MNTKLKFAFEKETKGAVRYQEIGEDGAPAFAPQVGTLYIRKSAMPGGKIPKTLIVTIAGEIANPSESQTTGRKVCSVSF
jgi:hypothetical protein